MLGPFETNGTTVGPLEIFLLYYVHSILGPSKQFERYIYWAHSCFTSTLHRGPIWVLPNYSVYLHMGFYKDIAYILRHYVLL
jgi:hypothetical protein